jgi:hypothetical protein
LDNNRIRKIITNFEVLIDVSAHDNAHKIKYNYCIPHYRDGLTILQQKREFTDEEVKQFQVHIDE